MFDFIYAEESILDHSRTRALIDRFPRAQLVPCTRYGAVFNRTAQNFRLQKRRPALILAHKAGRRVLPLPTATESAASAITISRTCSTAPMTAATAFQGLYRSAHLVLFVNYETSSRTSPRTSLRTHPMYPISSLAMTATASH